MARTLFGVFRGRRGRGLLSFIMAMLLAIGSFFALGPTDRRQTGRPEVVDGDTLRLADLTIRLKGVDAPEMQQTCERGGRRYRCGEVAKDALIARIGDGTIACRLAGRDRYGRSLGFCSVDGRDIGAWLVEEGLAVGYNDYEREEARARSRRAGLWAGSFERPQAWRQNRRSS
jgi:endonuclease YncB( thermonuclease family)